MSRCSLLISIALLVFNLAGCAGQAPPAAAPAPEVELRLAFSAGDTIDLLLTTEQTSTMSIMGREQATSQLFAAEIELDVIAVEADGSARLSATYTALRMTIDGPAGAFEFDSASPPDPVPLAARAASALLGQSLTFRMTPRGVVSDVQGYEELQRRMLEDLPGGAAAQAMIESNGGLLDDDGLAEMMQQLSGILPDRPVRVGDSWSRSASMTAAFAVQLENTWTLRDRRDGVAVIDVATSISSGSDPVTRVGTMTMRHDLAGQQSGTIEIEEASGWPLRTRTESTFAGTMTMEGIPGNAEGLTTPISVHSIVTVERLSGTDTRSGG